MSAVGYLSTIALVSIFEQEFERILHADNGCVYRRCEIDISIQSVTGTDMRGLWSQIAADAIARFDIEHPHWVGCITFEETDDDIIFTLKIKLPEK